jgi:hypothetical protein
LGVARRRSSFGNGEEGLLFLGQGIVKWFWQCENVLFFLYKLTRVALFYWVPRVGHTLTSPQNNYNTPTNIQNAKSSEYVNRGLNTNKLLL